MNILTWIKLAIGVVVGGAVFGGIQEFRMTRAVAAAVNAERTQQTKICDARVSEIASDMNADAALAVQMGKAAAESVEPTPTDKAEIKKLCDADPMCRDRQVRK